MKLQQQTTISQPLHHWDSDDYFGLLRFVGLAIAILIFATVTTAELLADEAALNESSSETAKAPVLPLIAGEWKLHSVTIEPSVRNAQSGDVPPGYIQDGKLVMHGQTVEMEVVKASEFKAEIKLTGPSGVPGRATIDRLGDVIKITSHEPAEPRNPQAENQTDTATPQNEAQAQPKFVILEFWKVDPNRSKTVQALRDLQQQINALRLEGRQQDMAAVEKKITDLTNTLKRMDVSPQITSLTQQALQARETGDHVKADELELEASKLSKQLFADVNDSAGQIQIFAATTPIKAGDVLNSSNSKLVAVDAESVPKGAMTEPAEVWGQFSSTPRTTGDWILSQQVQPNKTDAGSYIPPGYRVITIPVDATTNHSGLLQPGNRIDLLLTSEERDSNSDSGQRVVRVTPLLEYIEVFAVDSRQDKDADSTPIMNISLIVTTEQAMKVQMARQKGNISTVLRSSEDKDVIDVTELDESILFTDDTDQPSPFVGEWRLDSIEPESWVKEIVEDDPTSEDSEQYKSKTWIRNGVLNSSVDKPIDLGKRAVKLSEDKWEISLPGETPEKISARRFGTVLRLDLSSDGDSLVYEFYQVFPERKELTQKLISLNSQLSAFRTAGDASKSTELETNISQLNAKLEMLDAQPAVDSLTFMAIRAREKGDHSSARQFENDAKELANKLQQLDPKPESTPKDRLTAALEKIVSLHYDDVPLTEILKEIAKTHQINIALETRNLEAKGFAVDASISIHVDKISLSSALTLLLEQAGGIGFRIENEVLKLSPDLLGNRDFDRSLLEKQRANLIASLEELETESIKLAKNFRAVLAKLPPQQNSESSIETQELARLNIQLKRSVAFAFETRRKLQDVKLQLAELDLIEVKAKHERRGDLANQIIQRRITDLKNGGDLEWSKPSGSKADAAGRSQVQPEETPMMAPPALSLDFQQRRFECKANRWTDLPIQVFNDHRITQSATIRLDLPAGVTHRSTESNSEKTVECKITVPANTLTEKLAVLKADTVGEYEIPVTIIHDRKPGVPITIALNVTKSDGTSGTQDDQISASHLKPKIQQEPNVNSSPVASIAAEPMVAPKLASMAKTDIRPFTELSKENLTTAVFTNNGDDSMIVSPNESRGKYINRHLKRGEQITADMLMDKPSTEQIAGFWLGEAIAGKEVVESMESLSSKYPGSYSNAVNVPFNASYARDYNRNLPSWLPDYLQATEKRLRGVTPVDWSQDEFRILASLQDLTHYQTVNENHKLEGIGELLTAIVSSNSDSETEDVKDNLAVHSSWLLGQLIRITGHLPDNVLSTKPTTPAVVKKLQLLKTMTQKSADFTWIHQERRRLFGLGQEAPVQALKLLLTSKPISERRLLEKFLYAISAEETYDARHSESSRGLPPPIDPVVVIAVAELLAGHDEITDNNLMWLFTLANPSASFQPFSKHVDELLSSELAYRDSMLELLRSIYAKSKSPILKKNLALLAPGVTVQGKK